MSTFKEVVRRSLIEFPLSYKCPLDVSISLFAEGAHTWKDGEINTEYFRDLPSKTIHEKLPSEVRMQRHRLQYDTQVMYYNWLIENMGRILEAEQLATLDMFGVEARHSDDIYEPAFEANGLNPPANIKPDWAEALYWFLNWWQVRLNYRYGVDVRDGRQQKDFRAEYWPPVAQRLWNRIDAVIEEIYPVCHNGRDYQMDMAAQRRLVREVVDDLNAELAAAQRRQKGRLEIREALEKVVQDGQDCKDSQERNPAAGSS